MKRILLPQVSLPYDMVRGSIQARQQQSVRVVDNIFKDLYERLNKGEITLAQVQDVIDANLPSRRIRIITKSAGNDISLSGASDINYSDVTGMITSTTVEIPIKNGKIGFKDFGVIIHEIRHVIDQLFHPKMLARNQFMANHGYYENGKYDRLYDRFLYNEEITNGKADRRKVIRKLEHKIRHFLRYMTPEEKINYIQDLKYGMEMENWAYSTELKYAKKLRKKHRPLPKEEYTNWNALYMFDEKIKLLKEIGLDIIKESRAKQSKRVKLTKNN